MLGCIKLLIWANGREDKGAREDTGGREDKEKERTREEARTRKEARTRRKRGQGEWEDKRSGGKALLQAQDTRARDAYRPMPQSEA